MGPYSIQEEVDLSSLASKRYISGGGPYIYIYICIYIYINSTGVLSVCPLLIVQQVEGSHCCFHGFTVWACDSYVKGYSYTAPPQNISNIQVCIVLLYCCHHSFRNCTPRKSKRRLHCTRHDRSRVVPGRQR